MPTETENLQAFLADPLRSIVVRLGKNAITAALPELDLTNFIECTFPGYAPLTVTPDSFDIDPTSEDDAAQGIAKVHFEAVDVMVPEYVTCYVVTQIYDGGAPILLRSFWSDPPFLIDQATELDFDLRLLFLNLEPV